MLHVHLRPNLLRDRSQRRRRVAQECGEQSTRGAGRAARHWIPAPVGMTDRVARSLARQTPSGGRAGGSVSPDGDPPGKSRRRRGHRGHLQPRGHPGTHRLRPSAAFGGRAAGLAGRALGGPLGDRGRPRRRGSGIRLALALPAPAGLQHQRREFRVRAARQPAAGNRPRTSGETRVTRRRARVPQHDRPHRRGERRFGGPARRLRVRGGRRRTRSGAEVRPLAGLHRDAAWQCPQSRHRLSRSVGPPSCQ